MTLENDLFPSSLEEHHVPVSVSQALEEDSRMTEETSHLNLLSWLIGLIPNGFSGKTYPESCHLMEDGTLLPFSEGWQNAGMGSPTGS